MRQSKLWKNVYVDGDAYTAGFLGLHCFPSEQSKRNRDRYESLVEDVLSKYGKYDSSKALLGVIANNTKKNKVVIVPSRGPNYPAPRIPPQFEQKPTAKEVQCDARASPDDWNAARPAGLDCAKDWEHPDDKSNEGTGKGTDSTVYYSPWVWPDQGNALCSEDNNAGNSSDEVLLHELVHSMEQVEGKLDQCEMYPPRFDPTYATDNVAEFFAVLVANLYSSETGRKLRQDHGSFKVMPAQVATSKAFYSRHSSAVVKLGARYPALVNSLESLSNVPFNPFFARRAG